MMRFYYRRLFIFLTIFFLTLIMNFSFGQNVNITNYEVFFDKQKIFLKSNFIGLDLPIYQKNNELMISIRIIQEYMYKDTSWDFLWRTFSICGLEFRIDISEVHTRIPALDGNKIFSYKMSEAPTIIGGRYYVPLLETMKLFGNSTVVSKESKTVKITRLTSPSFIAPGLQCR